ncbi:MAG TPA: hypothetical protein VKI99_07910 [Candidatus Dormibacteraeota bacterium]|nr:hypothetical protein [Candidatus Dormibacteraeota bacterium]
MTSPRPPIFTSNLIARRSVSPRLRAIFLACYMIAGLGMLAFLIVR